MPRVLQLISGTVNAGAAGENTAVAAPGDSFTVAAGVQEGNIYLAQLWAAGTLTDYIKVYSPRMHDNTQGIRVQAGTTKGRELLQWGQDQPLYPADSPTFVTHSTGIAETGLLAMYEYLDLPGGAQRLAMWEEVRPRIDQISGTEVDVTSSATIGTWGTGVAINADFDNFKANREYALLGYTVNAACQGVSIVGPDTSNYRIGGPGEAGNIYTHNQFVRMSMATGRPCIPIIQANNRGATLVQAVDTAASTAVHVSLYFALLK